MYEMHDKLRDKIIDLNIDLKEKYEGVFGIERDELRKFIAKKIGKIRLLEKLDPAELELYRKKGGIVGVDGSNNRVGGSQPHFVEGYQALAKSTLYRERPLFLAEIYTPLGENAMEGNLLEEEPEDREDKKNTILAELEVRAAIDSIEEFQPQVIMMDGGLIRYNIYAKKSWESLRSLCEEKDIILIGVIEDIKTSIIGDALKNIRDDINFSLYDREILFGQLAYGEMIIINERVNKKGQEGYSSAFIRSSQLPSVIGMDILDSQKGSIEDMARLVLSLTPETSRGIPLWLDIVDEEVKISDEMMKGLLENYMDRSLYERFFVAQREKRD